MSVEDEVVSMKFDNKTFEAGVKVTLSSLDKLKQSLKFEGADQGLTNVQRSIGGFKLGTVAAQVQGVSKSFLALSTIAITALSRITSAAIDAGARWAKSLTLQPILDGFKEYETNINSIQTILANTKQSGANLQDVQDALNKLNHYSDKTIYNFSEMAKNIGTFTAAGVDLDTSVKSIKGIANIAATAGTNSENASRAMYQLSQAISSGKVSLMDWRSVENAGMGTSTFKRALAQTAVAMGDLSDKSVKLQGKMKNVMIDGQSFRDSIMAKPGEVSWLSSKVLTNTLEQFSGDLSDAQLKAQGFNDEQIKDIRQMAKTAVNAATQVKTASQLIGTLKESAGSGWARTFAIIFGNFTEAKGLFTGLSKFFGGMITRSAKARNKVLQDWKDLGGRDLLIKGFNKALADLGDVIGPIKEGFRDIFPATTGKDLLKLTKAFADLMDRMALSETTMTNLRKTSAGFFAVLDIIWQIIKGVARGFKSFFDTLGAGNGHFLEFTGGIGDILVKFDEFLKKGDYIGKFFEGLGAIIATPVKWLLAVASAIGSLFDGFDDGAAKAFEDGFGRASQRMDQLQGGIHSFMDLLSKLANFMQPVADAIVSAFGKLGDAIAQAMGSGSFDAVFDVINAVLLGGIALLIKRFFDKGLKFDFGQGGLIKSIKDTFGALGDTLGALQAQLKSKTLLNIALAVATLTASMVALSLIDSKKLSKALVAISVGFAQLVGAMAILSKMSLVGGKVIALAAAMQIMAGAILTLALAVAVMGNLKVETIVKGLLGIGGALVVIGLAMKLMPKGMLLQAAALAVLGAALTAIGGAIALLGQLGWETIAKGLLALAGALLIIAGAIQLIPPTAILQAAAIAVLAKGILIIAAAVALLGQLGWEQIAKGLVALAGALLIIAGALYLMEGALPGAAALVVAAAALAVLAPVLVTLGAMSWMSIVKGLTALAAAFVIIGLAGLVLAPLVPVLIGLGAALALIGIGLALAGAGAFLFATAFSIFIAALTAGIAIIGTLTTAIPAFMTIFAGAIVAFVKSLVDNADELVKAIVQLGSTILKGLTKLIPQVGKLITTLIQTLIHVIRKNAPDLFATGLWLMLQFLKALNKNVPKIVKVATDLIVNFLNALGKNLPRIVDAGFKLIIKLIDGVTKAVDKHSDEIGAAGGRLAVALVKGMANGIRAGVGEIGNAAEDLAQTALDKIKHPWKIFSPSHVTTEYGEFFSQGLANGIRNHSNQVYNEADKVGKNTLKTIKDAMAKASREADLHITNRRPVITPVVDLSEVRKGVDEMGRHFDKHTIRADVSRHTAKDIAAVHAARHANEDLPREGNEYKFEQNLYSPKPINAVDAYRGQKSQIAMFREVTGK